MVKHRFLNAAKSADDFLETLPPKQYKQVVTKVWELRHNPRPHDSIKLTGLHNKYRTDIGEYRIIYTFNDSTVDIEAIGKRNDGEVYRKTK